MRLLRRLATCGLAWLGLGAAAPALAVEASELKAAIVYNILQFVEWPADAESPRGVITLCVDGAGQMPAFFKLLAGRSVQRRLLEVAELGESVDAFKPCHAVFIDTSSRRAAAVAARIPQGLPLLVLADLPVPPPETIVHLIEAGDRIAFNIDLGAARRNRLQVSSRLLRLAKKVTE